MIEWDKIEQKRLNISWSLAVRYAKSQIKKGLSIRIYREYGYTASGTYFGL